MPPVIFSRWQSLKLRYNKVNEMQIANSGIQLEQPSRTIGQLGSAVGVGQGGLQRLSLARQVNGQFLMFHEHDYFAAGGDDLREPNHRATLSGINSYLHHLLPEPTDDIDSVINMVKGRERMAKPLRAQIRDGFAATGSPLQAARQAVHRNLEQLALTAKAPFEQLTPSLPPEVHVKIAERLSSNLVHDGKVIGPTRSEAAVSSSTSDSNAAAKKPRV